MIRRLVFSWRGALLGMLAGLGAVGLAIPGTAAASVTSVTSCQTISVSGKYRLDADITTADFDCFGIAASNVTLTLNGHTVTASASELRNDAIEVFGGATNVKIVGPGTLTGAWGSAGVGFDIGSNGSVRGVTANNVAGNGIDIQSAGNDIRGNVATGSDFGIVAEPGATDNTIIGNVATGNLTVDLFDSNANCDSNVWRGNDFGTADISCIH